MSDTNIYVGVAGYVGRPEDVGAIGVFRRPADGGEWQHVLADREVYTVFVHPADANLVFAGSSDGVWLSTDRGASFRRADFPDGDRQIWSFLVIEGAPDRMYAGSSPLGVYRSDDRGRSWKRLPDPKIAERCSGPFAPRVMRMVQRPGHPDEIDRRFRVSRPSQDTAVLRAKNVDVAELASWTTVARVILNLHETITRR